MTSSPEPELLSRQHDGGLWLTINRPERRNAISPAVLDGLSQALSRANQDREVRAIVLTGVGDKAFCAGADLQTGQSFKFDYSEPTQGMANLSAVAPGISSALLTTVVGLVVAIPSALGSNKLSEKIRFLSIQMENFTDKFASRLQQAFLYE